MECPPLTLIERVGSNGRQSLPPSLNRLAKKRVFQPLGDFRSLVFSVSMVNVIYGNENTKEQIDQDQHNLLKFFTEMCKDLSETTCTKQANQPTYLLSLLIRHLISNKSDTLILTTFALEFQKNENPRTFLQVK